MAAIQNRAVRVALAIVLCLCAGFLWGFVSTYIDFPSIVTSIGSVVAGAAVFAVVMSKA